MDNLPAIRQPTTDGEIVEIDADEYSFLPLEPSSRTIYIVHYLIQYSNGDRFVGTYQSFFHSKNEAEMFVETHARKQWITANPATQCIGQDYAIIEFARVPF